MAVDSWFVRWIVLLFFRASSSYFFSFLSSSCSHNFVKLYCLCCPAAFASVGTLNCRRSSSKVQYLGCCAPTEAKATETPAAALSSSSSLSSSPAGGHAAVGSEAPPPPRSRRSQFRRRWTDAHYSSYFLYADESASMTGPSISTDLEQERNRVVSRYFDRTKKLRQSA